MEILLEVHKNDMVVLEEIKEVDDSASSILKVNKFGGDADLMAAVVTLSSVTIPVLGKIIVEMLRAKKYVKIKVKGIEIETSGVSEKKIISILESYAKKEKK